MQPRRYSTFQFLHPDLDIVSNQDQDLASDTDPSQAAAKKRGGFQVVNGRLAMVSGQASVRQATLLLLSTQPQERVMRPDHGCDLRQFVHQPNNHETVQRAKAEVQRALQSERRITSQVQASTDQQHPECVEIAVDYQVKGEQNHNAINFALSRWAGLNIR